MSTLKVRVISALVGAVLVLGMTFSTPVIFHIAVTLACFIMLYELHGTFALKSKWQLLALNYVFASILLCLPAILPYDRIVPVLVIYLILLLCSAVIFHQTVTFADVSHSLFMILYAVLLPMHLSGIRMMEHGVLLIILTFLGAWMPDTFAFFAGCLLGKHKLIPAVSPKKTVEGSIGALVGALVTFLLFGLILQFGFHFHIHYPALLVLALLCGVVAQFGDLAASRIKRSFNIKDFGNIMPGHGGLTDRVDSLVFVAPVVYYFLLLFEVIYK